MSTEKGFFEMIELSGTGIAGIKGEGDVITYDTMNQEFNKIYPVYTYSKSARMTMESMEDNLYQSLLERFGQQLVKAHAVNDDFQGVSILNNATSTTWMDGSTLLSTSHKVARGGTNSNRLSPDLDLSADAIEQAIILLHQFLNPDGILGDYEQQRLVIPTALQFVAQRATQSSGRPSTTDNDINVVKGIFPQGTSVWRRLSSATTWFITTNADNGFMMIDRKGLTTKTFDDPYTYDMIITAHKRRRYLVGDHRCVVGSVGP